MVSITIFIVRGFPLVVMQRAERVITIEIKVNLGGGGLIVDGSGIHEFYVQLPVTNERCILALQAEGRQFRITTG